MFKRIICLSALTALLLTSCSSNGCYESTDVKVYCNLYSTKLEKNVGLDSVTVWGVGSDSLIYENDKVDELAFELNPKAQLTQYVVKLKSNGYQSTDTISFYHTNDPWFQSMDCGCMIFSKLDSCKTSGNIFKLATIVHSSITNKKTEHVVLTL